jgi:hypothetical protein
LLDSAIGSIRRRVNEMKKLHLLLVAVTLLVFMVQPVMAGPEEDAFLKELQEELHRRGDPWIAGKTPVSHLSFEEKKKLCNLPLISERERHPERERLSKKPKNPPPVAMDWRNYQGHNWMTAVNTQEWNDCWAFAWCGAHEARMKVFRDEPTGTYNLSEQFVISCNPYGYDCMGGGLDIGDWVMTDGVPEEACFPYRGLTLPCTQRCSDWEARVVAIGGKITDWGETSTDTDSVKEECMNGPTAIGVNWKEGKSEGVREDFFYYRGGVYEPVLGEWTKGAHAICLCGWNSSGNWLIKNSWGAAWGDGGYAFVSKAILTNVWMVPEHPSLARITLVDALTSETTWDPGEQTDVVVTLKNVGSDALNVQAIMSTGDSHVTVDTDSSNIGDMSGGSTSNNSLNPFKVTASSSAPAGHIVQCNLHVTADGGYSNDIPFTLSIGFTPCEMIDDFPLPPAPGDTCLGYGLAYDGTNLYITDWSSPFIYKLDREGNLLGTIPSPEDRLHCTGIDYDIQDSCLWVMNADAKKVYKVNPSNGSVLTDFASPATQYPTGLAFDGTDLWVVDRDANTIYQVTTAGSVVSSFTIPITTTYGPRGLAYDPTAESVHGEGTLILFVTHFNSVQQTVLDSCAIHEIKRDGTLIPEHMCITPGNTGANGRVVCVDPESGDYWVDGGKFGPVYRMTGFHKVRVTTEERTAPSRLNHLTVLPNPARHETSVSFYMSGTGRVGINIYDVTGKLVSCLADKEFQVGLHQVNWPGIGHDGRKLPSGIYFCRVESSQFKVTKKLVIVR